MSLEACPCPQTLFLPTVTFCSKQCPLCKKSLRNMVIRKFSLSPEMLLSVPCNASPVSQSPSTCSFSAGVQGISDFSPMLNHSIYRNMSETAETKQVKHSLSQDYRLLSWKINGKSWLLHSNNCQKSATLQTHSGVGLFTSRNRVKIQINVIHVIQIHHRLMSSLSMMFIAYDTSIPEWALLGLCFHDLLP